MNIFLLIDEGVGGIVGWAICACEVGPAFCVMMYVTMVLGAVDGSIITVGDDLSIVSGFALMHPSDSVKNSKRIKPVLSIFKQLVCRSIMFLPNLKMSV